MLEQAGERTQMASAVDKLALAQRHFRRVQIAWPDPTDWDDLFLYGFYALAVQPASRPELSSQLRELGETGACQRS